MTGVSVSALRFYDQMGLIKPSYVDEETGFRYYGYEHFWQIEIIKMCRDMKLPLKDLKGVLESQDDQRFVDFLEEQRKSVKAELRRLKEVVADIGWMERQWTEKARIQKGDLIYQKHIPERAVVPAFWEEDFTNDSLHLKLQQLTENELKHLKSIKRHYGYYLDLDKFLNSEIDTLAEYLELESYRNTDAGTIEILPAGDYACCITKIFSRDMDLQPFLDYLNKNDLHPKRVIASEVALTFFDWRECLFEIQALIK
ncbi:DNA-binding transcriptional regulator, MerR family [Sporobacter termitidis DSM 10068]|uniref:DNA-binding transcriptional regulator, MerR family n=2 Tax=Sporobacter TaxID=44748 RepID=A0A1M5XEQ4_9FIRM|nr:DNA-binding transcriptional regulator, MerR family [Sporobacter termitidis DSM 10068]